MRLTRAFAVLSLVACTTPGQPVVVTSVAITNEYGHVIGRRDIVENQANQERWSNYTQYEAVKDESGRVVAYEERVPDGTIRYALNGRRIGGTFKDLRSGSTFGVLVRPAE